MLVIIVDTGLGVNNMLSFDVIEDVSVLLQVVRLLHVCVLTSQLTSSSKVII